MGSLLWTLAQMNGFDSIPILDFLASAEGVESSEEEVDWNLFWKGERPIYLLYYLPPLLFSYSIKCISLCGSCDIGHIA